MQVLRVTIRSREEREIQIADYLLAGGEWQKEAAQGGAIISEYIFEMVEKARRRAEDVV
jgi:hypothetical protein